MRKENIIKGNKVISFSVAILLLVLTICSVSVNKVSAATYTPRVTAPHSSNKYYYSDINVFYKYGYGMPNCTAYAYGRAYEILQKKPNLSVDSAKYWYDYNKENGYYPYGQTPKLGAIACWSYSSGGHVAVVEEITDTTITFSNSAWGWQNFYLTTADINAKNPGQSGWLFQGYIYIGDFTEGEKEEIPTGRYRITSDDGVNLRSGAGTSYGVIGFIDYNEVITVTKTTTSGGYKWGYVNHNGISGWCVLDYSKYLGEAEPPTQPPTEAQTEPPTEMGCVLGDVNGDGTLNVLDATHIQKHLVKLVPESDVMLDRADYNGDNDISVLDATAIQKKLAGMI